MHQLESRKKVIALKTKIEEAIGVSVLCVREEYKKLLFIIDCPYIEVDEIKKDSLDKILGNTKWYLSRVLFNTNQCTIEYFG